MHGKNKGDSISGDRLYIECRKPGKWQLFRKSGNHKGSETRAEKDATAVIENAYTNQKT